MTTIVALHVPGKGTHIGSESMVSAAGKKAYMTEWKWILDGTNAVGVAGYASMIALFRQYSKDLLSDLDGPFEFGQRVLELTEAHKWHMPTDEDGGPRTLPADIIFAQPEGAWSFDGTMTHMELGSDMLTAGSGRSLALGAAYATRGQSPQKRVITALEAACAYDLTSGGTIRTGFLPLPRPKRIIVAKEQH